MMSSVTIEAKNLHYTPLNQQIRREVAKGVKEIVINNVLGQRFIGDGLRGEGVTITVNGVPGGDLAMFNTIKERIFKYASFSLGRDNKKRRGKKRGDGSS